MSGELKAADLARRHGVDRKTAYRWLVQLEAKYGAKVVARRGKRGVLVTTEDAFAEVAPLVAEKARDDRRIRELEERLADAETRADKHARDIADLTRQFRQLSFSWFQRRQGT